MISNNGAQKKKPLLFYRRGVNLKIQNLLMIFSLSGWAFALPNLFKSLFLEADSIISTLENER